MRDLQIQQQDTFSATCFNMLFYSLCGYSQSMCLAASLYDMHRVYIVGRIQPPRALTAWSPIRAVAVAKLYRRYFLTHGEGSVPVPVDGRKNW